VSAAVSALAGAEPAEASTRSARPRGRLAHIPAFDGIRAVALIAMLLFHGGISWMPGGALGVDVFFVLSGFLITALLVREYDRNGRISLKQFYIRRVRRLLPAIVVVLIFVGIVWGLLLKAKSPMVRGDELSTLFYVANWRFALTGQGYFESFTAPSPLRHCWSLAVEEQFYLIWPLVVILLISKRRSIVRWAYALVGLAFLATLFQSLAGVWTDRLYYGTDTRAIPLLLGSAIGAWYARRPEDAVLSTRAKTAWQLAGFVGAAGMAYSFTVVHGSSEALYRGGFVFVAATVAILMGAVALVPHGWLAPLLSWQPLRYLGVISYGVYLWHWPLFLLITHERTGLGVPALLFVRLTVSVAVAMVSYHLLEQPIRERRWHLPKSLPKALTRARVTAPIGLAALVGVLVAATPAPSTSTRNITAAGPPVNTDVGSPAPPGASRVLFVGDSMAVSLADALARSEVPYDVHIDNAGLLGCGIALGSPRRFRGTESDDPSFCKNWPQLRGEALAKDKPDLAVALVGEWELMDRKRDGKWVHIGQPAYDAYLSQQLDLLIKVMSAGGTHIALLTTPCRRFDESANGAPWPESSGARLDRFNELLRAAVARHPRVASVVDFKSMVCPGGTYVSHLSGVQIRNVDGIHFPNAAIPPIAKRLLPVLRSLATS
jgi:peptidoglycan/LPS O-acetylase OafA/YrhL